MPLRHPEPDAAARSLSGPAPLSEQGEFQMTTTFAPQQPTSDTARSASYLQLRGMQEFSAGHLATPQGSPQPTMIRWVSRLTEFLRTTAARSVDGMDRVMGEMSFSPSPMITRTPPRSSSSAGTAQQPRLMDGQGLVQPFNISPPEELGSSLAIPATWSQPSPSGPLFDSSQLAQLQQAHTRAPLLFRPTETAPRLPSEGSSTVCERTCRSSWMSTTKDSNLR